MHRYECDFSVNGTRTKQIVVAQNSIAARKIIESQYPGAKITWWGTGTKDLGRA